MMFFGKQNFNCVCQYSKLILTSEIRLGLGLEIDPASITSRKMILTIPMTISKRERREDELYSTRSMSISYFRLLTTGSQSSFTTCSKI